MNEEIKSDARRYDHPIDPNDKGTAHTTAILLAGAEKNVLEFGPSTGYMSRVLRDRGCRVTAIELDPAAAAIAKDHCDRLLVADAEELDFEAVFGKERFDVILFIDVLEHLKDPESMLRKVRPLLAPDGYIVASIPNVAHASIRLMLLDGKFTYGETGLLDRTHIKFFTRDTIISTFERAGYLITNFQNVTIESFSDPYSDQTPLREDDFPPLILDAIRADPNAFIFQFVFQAVPGTASLDGDAATPKDWQPGIVSRALWQTDEAETSRIMSEKTAHIIRLEQDTRSLSFQLEAHAKSLARLNARLLQTEKDAAETRALRQELSQIKGGIGWRIYGVAAAFRHSLLPESSFRGRVWRRSTRFLRHK